MRHHQPYKLHSIALPLALGAIVIAALAAGAASATAPFAAAFFIAYVLRPAADYFEHKKMSRHTAAALTLGIFFGSLLSAVAFLAPPLFSQAAKLTAALAQEFTYYADKTRSHLLPKASQALSSFDPHYTQKAKSSLAEAATNLPGALSAVLERAWDSATALTGAASFMLVTPLIAFYMLADRDKISEGFYKLPPIRMQQEIKNCVAEIDSVMASYLRGQGLICMTLGALYAGGLTLVDVNYGFVIGFISGLLAFVPYLGMTTGLVIASWVSWSQYQDWGHIALVAGVFIIGQTMEGLFLTPKVMGEKVGLHPVWILFALMSGGGMFGFAGVLLAVPAAACIGALVRYLARKYYASSYYRSPSPYKKGKPRQERLRSSKKTLA